MVFSPCFAETSKNIIFASSQINACRYVVNLTHFVFLPCWKDERCFFPQGGKIVAVARDDLTWNGLILNKQKTFKKTYYDTSFQKDQKSFKC